MSQMLWELALPSQLARAKEDISKSNLWKYARYYRMYMERYKYTYKGKDLTNEIERTLFFRGICMLVKNEMYDTVAVCEVDEKSIKKDVNGKPIRVTGTALDGVTKYKNMEVGKDCILMYADSTHIAPILYIWALANDIIELDDILRTQNNMLRKPIIVSGEGAGFDEAMNKVQNVLSGVAWFNYNQRKNKKSDSIMATEQPVEVLNLQVGNSYKGIEIWDNIKHKEEFICDYLGYTTTKNEKRERMNSLEITNENSIGMTFYKAQTDMRKQSLKDAGSIGIEIDFEELLQTEGGEENDKTNDVVRTNDGK